MNAMRWAAAGRGILLGAAIAAGVALAPARAAAQFGLEVGAKAPDAAVETLDGTAARLAAAFAGRPALIEFWATWCPNCRELEPQLAALQRQHAGKVAFIGVAVSVNQTPERVRRYVAEHLQGFTHFYDRRGDAVGEFDVPATSYIVVVDRRGTIVYTGVGGDQQLAAAVEKALRQP